MARGKPLMVDPSIALVIGTLFIALLLLFLWPKRGVLARWQLVGRSTSRVLVEDALKHVYDCEYKSVTSSLQSIAGALDISGDKAVRLVSHHMRLLGILYRDPDEDWLILVDYDDTK